MTVLFHFAMPSETRQVQITDSIAVQKAERKSENVETKSSMTNWRETERDMFNLYTCNGYFAVEKDEKWI